MSTLDYKTGTNDCSLAAITVQNGVYNDPTEKKTFKLESLGTEEVPIVSLSEVKKQDEAETNIPGTFSKLLFYKFFGWFSLKSLNGLFDRNKAFAQSVFIDFGINISLHILLPSDLFQYSHLVSPIIRFR